MSYKEGLAQSQAAKGPKMQLQGPSEAKSFSELGVCESLDSHLAGRHCADLLLLRRRRNVALRLA